MTQMTTINGLWTMRQVADRLGISTETAYRLARHREIPSVKIGGSVRVDPNELEAYLDRQRATA